MDYKLIYSIENQYNFFNGFTLLAILFLVLLISALIMIKNNYKEKKPLKNNFIFILFSLFMLYLFSSDSFNVYKKHKKLVKKFYTEKIQKTEGVVKEFTPMRIDGKRPESFTVNRIKFIYNYYEDTGTFNMVKSKGSPIKKGSKVRITYFYQKGLNRNLILKLEIKN